MTRSVISLTVLLGTLVFGVVPSQAEEGAKPVETFSLPLPTRRPHPKYPAVARMRAQEGWVEVQFMVDPNGKPYEITVTDSMGHAEFSKAAVRAVEGWEYDAARMNGQPLDAAARQRLIFSMTGTGAGVRSVFSQRFISIKMHIKENERTEALELLEKAESRNLYEEVFLQIGWYLFHLRWGTPEQQRIALTRASASDPDTSHVPVDFIQMIMLARFRTEIQTNHLGAALITAKAVSRLQEEGKVKLEADRLRSLNETVSKIEALKKDDVAFSVNGVIGEHANWTYSLLKDEMTFHVLEGEIAELKLRCDRRYVGFRFAADSTFKIPESYGNCQLEVIGNPGTTFTLTQS